MPAVDLLTAGTALLDFGPAPRYGSHETPAVGWEMQVELEQAQAAGRRFIIERPRLTKILDEANARVIMLVAAAGYGKTTLAEQWTSRRTSCWYQGSAASADVAALSVGLARTAAPLFPGAGERMGDRMRATGTPEKDVEVLAELLAEDLAGWPDDAWLVIDDYQFVAESEASERFVELLHKHEPIRLLVTSRVRPGWATARRLLYGEIVEVGQSQLAMDAEEAANVLGQMHGAKASGLVALAEGWPAVIGLAAYTDDFALPEGHLPGALYAYFAEELYQAAEPGLQARLCRLSLVPRLSADLADFLLGADASAVLSAGIRLGFLTPSGQGVHNIHPLLRAFLESKIKEWPEAELEETAAGLVRHLAARELWDDAFYVVSRFGMSTLLPELLELAFEALLQEGRLTTLSRWTSFATKAQVDSPLIDLAEAAIAFGHGDRARAETLAVEAARMLEDGHGLKARALLIAGASANLNYRHSSALDYNRKAETIARGRSEQWDAVRGQLLAASALESDSIANLLEVMVELQDGSAESNVQLAADRYYAGIRLGALPDSSERLASLRHLLPRVRNPLVSSSFLHLLGQALLYEGFYAEAFGTAEELSRLARKERLSFILPYTYLTRAAADLGLRNFGRSLRFIYRAEQPSHERSGTYLVAQAALVKSRLALVQGQHQEAMRTLEEITDLKLPRGEAGERIVGRALALACLGQVAEAVDLADESERLTKGIEVQAFGPLVRLVAAVVTDQGDAPALARTAAERIRATRNIDAFVCSYRSCPIVLPFFAEYTDLSTDLPAILGRARDDRLGRTVGVRISVEQTRGSPLTAREQEVLALLVQGFTNRQIASALFISVATAKVHLHHIFEKLGVRSRTEAVVRAIENELV